MFNFNYNVINSTKNEQSLPSCEEIFSTSSFQEKKKAFDAEKELKVARKINLDNHFKNLTWGRGAPNPFVAKHSTTNQSVVVRQNLGEGNNQTPVNERNSQNIQTLGVLTNPPVLQKQASSQEKKAQYFVKKIHLSPEQFQVREKINEDYHSMEFSSGKNKMTDTSKRGLQWHHKLFPPS